MQRLERRSIVDVWLDNMGYSHSGSENTKEVYRDAFELWTRFSGLSAEYILKDYQASTEKMFKRKYSMLVREFVSFLTSKGYAVNTINSRVAVVKSFFKYNDLPLGYIPSGRYRVIYHNREILKEEIVAILGISKPRDRAFFSMMAQSGLRPQTLCKLKVKHLEPDFSSGKIPCKVDVPQEIDKGKYSKHFTFIGSEAVEHLGRYFATRGLMRRDSFVFTSYGTDKPLNTKSITQIFARAIEQLKVKGVLDFEQKKEGKPRTLRLYTLRKWFRKQAGHSGQDFVKFWMGHSLGVDEHYFSRDPEHHRKVFTEKALPHLRFEESTPTETDKVIQKQAVEIQELKKQAAENAELRKQVEELQKGYEKLLKLVLSAPPKNSEAETNV